MTTPPKTQAILLLTTHFTKVAAGDHKPLTPKEWGRFAIWLNARSLTPERLLTGDLQDLLNEWKDKTVTRERVRALLDRGAALALSMEKWLRAGLWVMTRSEPDYPKRLKQRLREDSPAVLFGCGNRALLDGGGLAVVGSRAVQDADLAYTRLVARRAAEVGRSIVSGGAKGVDQAAMLGALEAEGTAVGILADRLLGACTSAKYRRHILDNNLVLVSPFNPEAGFNTGNAMQRNKYIYCLADAGLAVHSGKKGGTWSGAHEVLKKRWVPLWVKPSDDPEAGNADLIRAGAHSAPLEAEQVDLPALFAPGNEASAELPDLLDPLATDLMAAVESNAGDEQAQPVPPVATKASEPVREERDDAPGTGADLSKLTFYDLFIAKINALCAERARSKDELAKTLDIKNTQADTWLKQAVAEGRLEKLSNPVRYRVRDNKQESFALE